MNERIRELAKQFAVDFLNKSGYDMREYAPFLEETEKFAELIVRECVDCLKPLSRNHSMVGAAQDTIREHFGVEE